MSTLDDISRIIAKIVHCSPEEIRMETAMKDVKADSLHWVQIIVAAETTFNIEMEIEQMKTMFTIEDLVKYIDSLKK